MLTIKHCLQEGGKFLGGSCEANTCDSNGKIGACCIMGYCEEVMEMTCEKLGGDFAGVGTTCGDMTCMDPSQGACCFDNGKCIMLFEDHCFYEGGDWQGSDSSCEQDSCGGGNKPSACCINGGCLMLPEEHCLAVLGQYNPTHACDVVECPTSCPEDVNADGLVNVSDLLAIIAAWGICP